MRPEEITMEWVKERCQEDADCLVWKRWTGKDGVPRWKFRDGELDSTVYLRRYVWQAAGNKPLKDGVVLTVACGNPRCLNPEHLKPIKKSEVLARTNGRPDVKAKRLVTLTKSVRSRAKIDMEAARSIRESSKTLTEIAREFGISFQRASVIRRGEAWRDLEANPFAGLGARP